MLRIEIRGSVSRVRGLREQHQPLPTNSLSELLETLLAQRARRPICAYAAR